MRLYTVEYDGNERIMISYDGGKTAYFQEDLGFCFTDMTDLVCHADLNALKAGEQIAANAAAAGKAVPAYETASLKLHAPIVRPRQDVVCLGINYTEHAEEAGKYNKEAFGGDRPATIYFSKRVSYAPGHLEAIDSHSDIVDRLDYECELGVILGKDAYKVKREDALNYVFGYTVINDVSARNLQTRHRQWYLGKGLDGFTPMGPCITTADEIGDPEDLAISCRINDELRQNSNTGLMIQTIGGAIEELSAGMTLQAGTIIAMGTPSGVGMGFDPPKFLSHGDVVHCYIEKIGDLINPVD